MNQHVKAGQSSRIARLGAAVPRYTSYPTAPHFNDEMNDTLYRDWLASVGQDTDVSLYLHIPYCDRLCWFCGCNTKHTLKYEPVATYVEILCKEINLVADAAGKRLGVREIHLGGGSPSMLSNDDMERIGKTIRHRFEVTELTRTSVEIDPSDMGGADYAGLKALGLNRASIGVQDFDPNVQQAINRVQTFEDTERVVCELRNAGARSLNIDALYGLPHQTTDSVLRTLAKVVSLKPDRIAMFGYAHVPWMKAHQRMINEDFLPDVEMRFEQAQAAAAFLTSSGYEAVGIDHFALPKDSLARAARDKTLRRNFQGYTDDPCDVLLGMGASSIGKLPQGHVQNIPATGNYLQAVKAGQLPVSRGFTLSLDDRIRGRVIEMLMCNFEIDSAELRQEFAGAADEVLAQAEDLARNDEEGLLVAAGSNFVIPDEGKPFARAAAARFDAYLNSGKARHSAGV
ncbi:MAG: oxygen-independent coproporphyrinogen III oxidase [Rhizobiaceae bacterium]